MKFIKFLNFTPSSPLDPDAQAFITAASISNSTQKSAINQLVLDLKSNNLWSKMKAVYPMVGGNSSAHKFNLKDPRDLDAAFRLAFNGTWTHNSAGASSNGAGSYANTFLVPQGTLGGVADQHISYYSRSSSGGDTDIGSGTYNGGGIVMWVRYSADNKTYTSLANQTFTTPTSGLGLHIATANSSATKIVTPTSSASAGVAAGSLSNVNVYIGGSNNSNSLYYPTARNCAFASVGNGLSDSDCTNLQTIVNNYQQSLGRKV
jgi:hypothetical protein